MNKSFQIRKERYESRICEIISQTIITEIYDDLIKQATILGCKLNNDYSIAKIYVSTFNESEIDMVLKKINSASSFFKKILSNELKLKKTPNIFFVKDESNENFQEVEKILQKIKGE